MRFLHPEFVSSLIFVPQHCLVGDQFCVFCGFLAQKLFRLKPVAGVALESG